MRVDTGYKYFTKGTSSNSDTPCGMYSCTPSISAIPPVACTHVHPPFQRYPLWHVLMYTLHFSDTPCGMYSCTPSISGTLGNTGVYKHTTGPNLFQIKFGFVSTVYYSQILLWILSNCYVMLLVVGVIITVNLLRDTICSCKSSKTVPWSYDSLLTTFTIIIIIIIIKNNKPGSLKEFLNTIVLAVASPCNRQLHAFNFKLTCCWFDGSLQNNVALSTRT